MHRDINALDSHLQQLFETYELPGISVAAWGPDGEAFAKGYGRANLDGSRRCDADTVFGIASMSKSQTTLACAILATEGKLSFSDPVYKYFPNFRVPGAARDTVLLRHLAMHTAGIPPIEPLEWSIAMHDEGRTSEWAIAMRKSAPNPMDTIDQIIDYIANCEYPMLGAPGEYMSYCNEGYALLSYVVDQVAGMPLEHFLKERIYQPLGMTRTVLDEDASEAIALSGGNITSLFETEDGKLTCDDNWSVAPPYRGCGWVKSTARDMAAYYRCLSNWGMHEGKQAIPREAVEMLIGAGFPLQKEPVYAYGLEKRDIGGHTVCEHAGGLHGVATYGGLLLGEGWGFAALCNHSDGESQPFVAAMYNWALGQPLDTNLRWFAPADHPFSDPEMAIGVYRAHEGIPSDVTIYRHGTTLMARRDGKDMLLSYCGGNLFAHFTEKGTVSLRLRVFIRDGKAWAVSCGTRMYQRLKEA